MTTEPLDACAAAIYAISPDEVPEHPGCYSCAGINRPVLWEELSEFRRNHYREAARACLEATLPVSDEVMEAMQDACYPNGEGHDLRFTAAIHAITKQENV